MLSIFTVKLQETVYYENQIHINLAQMSHVVIMTPGNQYSSVFAVKSKDHHQPGFTNKGVMDYKLYLHFNEVYPCTIH